MSPTTVFLKANKNLFRNKIRNLLTLAAIIISAVVFILIIYAATGLENLAKATITPAYSSANSLTVSKFSMESQEIANEDGIPIYTPFGESSDTNKSEINNKFSGNNDLEKIKKIPNVKKVYPQFGVRNEYIERNNGAKKYSVGVTNRIFNPNTKVVAGEDVKDTDLGKILVPQSVTKVLGFSTPESALNQRINIVFFNQAKYNQLTNSDDSLQSTKYIDTKSYEKAFVTKTYTIKGVTESYQGAMINISFADEEKLYEEFYKGTESYGKYYTISVLMQDGLSAEEVNEVKTELQNLGYNFADDNQQLREIINLIGTIQLAAMSLASIGLIAAFFGVINTQLMAVLERTKEIGLFRALGLSKGGVFWLFSFEALLLGLWGAGFGFGLAHLLSVGVNYFVKNNNLLQGVTDTDILIYSPTAWFVVAGIAFLTFVAGVIPSLKASKMDPIESLRYE